MNATRSGTFVLPCQVRAISDVRRLVRNLASEAHLSQEFTDDITLAVNEAASNAVRYASSQGAMVVIRWRAEGGCIEVEVEDEGVFRRRVPLPAPDDIGGRGIPLMLALMDEVHIREGTTERPGTVIRLVKCLPA